MTAMRAVIQRVKSASVEVESKIVSRIGQGWLCLVSWLLRTVDSLTQMRSDQVSHAHPTQPCTSAFFLAALPLLQVGLTNDDVEADAEYM